MNDSGKVSNSFELLHPNVQKWVYKQNWNSFHKIQEDGIRAILQSSSDIIISAATASGKTEAAFIPICSSLVESPAEGIGVLYISPLKALINDQFRRMESLFESIELPLTPWHGDISAGIKHRLRNRPKGGLLITPESLEALFITRGGEVRNIFKDLRFLIIDEFHAFIGSERGQQLLSLMHRLERTIDQKVRRIALSATLGDLETVLKLLRPGGNKPCHLIKSDAQKQEIKLQIRGYRLGDSESTIEKHVKGNDIVADLFKHLRGSSNLLFANSRNNVEEYATSLRERCESLGVPNEFFPHHGNLDKAIREDVEERFQHSSYPTTAVCTSTLELGIDIGQVTSIAQAGVPPSVSSMRQRLGRSGRRDEPSILRIYISEQDLDINSHPVDLLRMHLFQAVAMVELLSKKWYEPPLHEVPHYSTLVQQLLSVLAQYGGILADQAYSLLCTHGPFKSISASQFSIFLKGLAAAELIKQTHDRLLVLDLKGEKVVSHFTFYAAFSTPEEYRLEAQDRFLGTLPISYPIAENDFIIFAGKRWLVLNVDIEKKIIQLKPSFGGRAPRFGGEGMYVHGKIREMMYRLYIGDHFPIYLDEVAKDLFSEGKENFRRFLSAGYGKLLSHRGSTYLFVWGSDRTVFTLDLLFKYYGFRVMRIFNVLHFQNANVKQLKSEISRIRSAKPPDPETLVSELPTLRNNKHDHFVSDELLEQEMISKWVSIENSVEYLNEVAVT